MMAKIQIDAASRGHSVETVTSVQPTQLGLDKAESIRGHPLGKR